MADAHQGSFSARRVHGAGAGARTTNEIGPQTDVYALGAILYEMLNGNPVFAHPSGMMLMMMHVRDPFTPVRALASDVPEGVARAVERCLAKAPGNRPGQRVS